MKRTLLVIVAFWLLGFSYYEWRRLYVDARAWRESRGCARLVEPGQRFAERPVLVLAP